MARKKPRAPSRGARGARVRAHPHSLNTTISRPNASARHAQKIAMLPTTDGWQAVTWWGRILARSERRKATRFWLAQFGSPLCEFWQLRSLGSLLWSSSGNQGVWGPQFWQLRNLGSLPGTRPLPECRFNRRVHLKVFPNRRGVLRKGRRTRVRVVEAQRARARTRARHLISTSELQVPHPCLRMIAGFSVSHEPR